MYEYVITVGKALKRRFPDTEFIIKNTAFLDPSLRKMQKPDMQAVVKKFHTGVDPFQFDCSILSSQYRLYENDSTLDFQYELCDKDSVKFLVSVIYGGRIQSIIFVSTTSACDFSNFSSL